MTVTISRLYDTHNDAQQAVRRLESAGVPHSDISIVANNSDSWFNSDKKVDRDRDGVDDRAEGAGKGAGIGAGVGGTAGLLAGLGLLAIPGLGPVVAAGWLAAAAVGAAAGAATGGIVGALTEAGVSEEDAHSYAEGVRRGGTLVSARVADADCPASTRYRTSWQSTCVTGVLPGKRPGGNRSIRPVNPTTLRRSRKSGSCTAAHFAKRNRVRPAQAGRFLPRLSVVAGNLAVDVD